MKWGKIVAASVVAGSGFWQNKVANNNIYPQESKQRPAISSHLYMYGHLYNILPKVELEKLNAIILTEDELVRKESLEKFLEKVSSRSVICNDYDVCNPLLTYLFLSGVFDKELYQELIKKGTGFTGHNSNSKTLEDLARKAGHQDCLDFIRGLPVKERSL